MYNKAHIRLVDTHTECDGSNNDLTFFHQKSILVLASFLRIHTCMIWQSGDIVHLQNLRERLNLLARHTIYYTGFALHLLDEAHKILVDIFGLWTNFVIQVRTVERALEYGGITDLKILLNILLYFGSSSSGKGDNRCRADLLDKRADISVFGTEIVSPFGNTVRFIDSIEANFHSLQ